MRKSIAVLPLLGAAALAFAQAPETLGKVTDIRGIVTVSDGRTVGVAQRGTEFFDGTRFVSSPSGNAELTLDNGCVVRLKANESIVIRGRISCEELIALIQSVPGAPVVAGAGVSGGLAAVALLGAGVLAADTMPRSRSTGTNGGGGGNIPVPPVSGQ
jgi:hypothetical protein